MSFCSILARVCWESRGSFVSCLSLRWDVFVRVSTRIWWPEECACTAGCFTADCIPGLVGGQGPSLLPTDLTDYVSSRPSGSLRYSRLVLITLRSSWHIYHTKWLEPRPRVRELRHLLQCVYLQLLSFSVICHPHQVKKKPLTSWAAAWIRNGDCPELNDGEYTSGSPFSHHRYCLGARDVFVRYCILMSIPPGCPRRTGARR
ncbi:hypothetical protein FA95DRAFT_360761 [Auriscalpium vulgare]|uniref:Uncharacterized protein n=1 Tax=Auriscalpium vulgare TaxID=40419 RepID=A0ACB8RIJ7_9AGAM|nr:hypothetical protein FA95DRAFT_360761 [Auriscalpium vulgare]